ARSAGGTISGSSVQQVFAKLGAQGSGAEAVLGVCFLILAVLVAFTAAGQLTAARSEESAGRLDHLLPGPSPAGGGSAAGCWWPSSSCWPAAWWQVSSAGLARPASTRGGASPRWWRRGGTSPRPPSPSPASGG